MVRQKQISGSKTIRLMLMGAKTLIPKQQVVDVSEKDLGMTWNELITTKLQLQVQQNSGIFVCSSLYCPSSPKDGVGWRSELNEMISEFLGKYQRKKRQYKVRICRESDISSYKKSHPRGNRAQVRWLGGGSNGLTQVLSTRTRSGTSIFSAKLPSFIITARGADPSVSQDIKPPPNHQLLYRTRLVRLHERMGARGIAGNRNMRFSAGTQKNQVPQHNRMNPTVTLKKVDSISAPAARPQEDPLRIDSVQSLAVTSTVKVKAELPAVSTEEEEQNEEAWSRNWDEDEESQQQQQRCNELNRNGVVGGGIVPPDDEDMADAASLCTALNQQEHELRMQGIPVENIKSVAEEIIAKRFSNAIMLRMKDEIKKSKQNQSWDRVVSRIPLCSYFLTEIFKA